MRTVLADSSALLAMTMPKDQNHQAALAFLQENPAVRLIVPNTIFAETMVLTKARRGSTLP